MSKKDNFYLVILSLILMMFRNGQDPIITTSALVGPFIFLNDSMWSISRILISIDAFLALIGVLLFLYSSISLVVKVFNKKLN